MPNGVLDYDNICYGEFHKVDVEKVKKIKQILSTKQFKVCGENFSQINKYKANSRNIVKKLFDTQFHKLTNLGYDKKASHPDFPNLLPCPLNTYTAIKLIKDYKLNLVNISCRDIHRRILENALRIEAMHVTHRELKQRINYFGGLPLELNPFRFEDNHPHEADPSFIRSSKLLVNGLVGYSML